MGGATSRGTWNAEYADVYPVTFSGLTRSGRYQVATGGAANGKYFGVGRADQLYAGLVAHGVDFLPGAARRRRRDPRRAEAQAGAPGRQVRLGLRLPHFEPDGSDVITTPT
jgi:hypothetical protein